MRRRAVLEGAVEAAKTLLDIGLAQADFLERLDHQFGRLVPDRAGGNLEAVADQIVLIGLEAERVLGLERLHAALRHRERVVGEFHLLGVLVPFVERKVDDPAQLEPVAVDEVQFLAGAGAGVTGKAGEFGRIAGGEEAGVAILKPQLDADGFGALGADVLGDGAGAFEIVAFLAPEDVAQARLSLPLRPGIHPVAEGAGAAGLGGNGPDLDLGVIGDHAGEHLEAGAGEMFGDFLHLDRVAQVRLVGAIGADGLGMRDAAELLRHRLAFGEFLEDAAHHRLHRVPDVFLGDEAHFEVELVEFARQTVGARVLVAETRRDLEIAVEAGDHQQLLVLLRRLRQGVELAGMDAGGHQEVARAFGRRRRQDRRGIFGETDLGHAAAHVGDHLGAGDDVLVQRLAAQVEEAVFEPHVLGIIRLAEHRQRQFLRRREDFDLLGEDFDLAGGKIGVDGVGHALLDHAIDADHPFAAHLFGSLEGGRIRIGHHLGEAVMVAQVDEQQAAMVAHAVHPAGNPDGGAGVILAERGAGVGTVAMHGISSVA